MTIFVGEGESGAGEVQRLGGSGTSFFPIPCFSLHSQAHAHHEDGE
jgi:hypothetical protein